MYREVGYGTVYGNVIHVRRGEKGKKKLKKIHTQTGYAKCEVQVVREIFSFPANCPTWHLSF